MILQYRVLRENIELKHSTKLFGLVDFNLVIILKIAEGLREAMSVPCIPRQNASYGRFVALHELRKLARAPPKASLLSKYAAP